MNTVFSIIYIVGAALIGLGAFLIHLGKPTGAGLLTFGICLIGIGAKVINFGGG